MDINEEPTKAPVENVLPLINIVFLLLIFFMIAGTLIKPNALSIEIPNASVSSETDQNKLTITMDQQQFSVGNTLYTKTEIINFVTAEIEKDKNVVVQLKADSQIKSKNLIDFMDELGSTGLLSIRLITVK